MAEKCPNLTHLNLSGNKIKDLSTIEPLVSHLGPPLSAQGGRREGLIPGNTTLEFLYHSVFPLILLFLLHLTVTMYCEVEFAQLFLLCPQRN